MPMTEAEHDDLDFKLGQFFKPTMPINREDLFSGRQGITREVIAAVNQQGQHVILYGERGVGKTSMANMIMFNARHPSAHIMAPHINCTSAYDYSAIWMALLQEVSIRAEKYKVELPRSIKKLIHDFENGMRVDFSPELARRLVMELSEANMIVVLILDEFDTIAHQTTRQAVAETVKLFSDRNVPGTIVIIGVADDVGSLISEHQSIERCVAQIRMNRMSRDEIEQIVTTSLSLAGMAIEQSGLHEISRIAIGLPHYAHLLGLHSGRLALNNGSKEIKQTHVTEAARQAIGKAQVTIQTAYAKATISTKRNALYRQVLLACALAETDDFGYFAPTDIREPLEMILKRDYGVEAFARHLHAFCDSDRGPVLKKGELVNRPRFRFDNPLMQPFVLMKGLSESLITDDDLRATRDIKQGRLF